MATMLKWFDAYVSLGLHPIPVFKDTKCPAGGKGWNKDWSADRCRDYFQTDSYNMGIILGDIIDVEGDTQEGNDLLIRMIDGLPHPMFRSSKSIHHLFVSPDPNLTRRVVGGIEFRGHLHQSVVPPSIHEQGNHYQWLHGSKFPPPVMPNELLQLYLANRCDAKSEVRIPRQRPERPQRRKKKDGYTKTECKICKNSFYIHKKRLMLEVRAFRDGHGLPWMCHGCREFDMREPCRVIRRGLERDDSYKLIFQKSITEDMV